MFCGNKSCSGGVRRRRGWSGCRLETCQEVIAADPGEKEVWNIRTHSLLTLCPCSSPNQESSSHPNLFTYWDSAHPSRMSSNPGFFIKRPQSQSCYSPLLSVPMALCFKFGISFCLVLSQVIPVSQPDSKTFEGKSQFSNRWKKNLMVLAQGFACHGFSINFLSVKNIEKNNILRQKAFYFI